MVNPTIHDTPWRRPITAEFDGLTIQSCHIQIINGVMDIRGIDGTEAVVIYDGIGVFKDGHPIRLGHCTNDISFKCKNAGITKWVGFPQTIESILDVSRNRTLATYDGMPRCAELTMTSTGITTLVGIPPSSRDDGVYDSISLTMCKNLKDLTGIDEIKAEWFSFTVWDDMPVLRAVVSPGIEHVYLSHPTYDVDGINKIMNHARTMALTAKNKALMWAQREFIKIGRGDLARW